MIERNEGDSIFGHQAILAREENAYNACSPADECVAIARKSLLSRRLNEKERVKSARDMAIEIQTEILRIPPPNPLIFKNKFNQDLRRQKDQMLTEIIGPTGCTLDEIKREALKVIAVEAYINQQDVDLSLTNPQKLEAVAMFRKLQQTIEEAKEYRVSQQEIEIAAQPYLEKRRIEKRTAKIAELIPVYQDILRIRKQLKNTPSQSEVLKDSAILAERTVLIIQRDLLTRQLNHYLFSPYWKIRIEDLISK